MLLAMVKKTLLSLKLAVLLILPLAAQAKPRLPDSIWLCMLNCRTIKAMSVPTYCFNDVQPCGFSKTDLLEFVCLENEKDCSQLQGGDK